jgi:hypothetical protein
MPEIVFPRPDRPLRNSLRAKRPSRRGGSRCLPLSTCSTLVDPRGRSCIHRRMSISSPPGLSCNARRLSHKPNRLYEFDNGFFADLVRAAQAAQAGPSRPKWLTPKPSPCSKRTKSRARRWFVRQPPRNPGGERNAESWSSRGWVSPARGEERDPRAGDWSSGARLSLDEVSV